MYLGCNVIPTFSDGLWWPPCNSQFPPLQTMPTSCGHSSKQHDLVTPRLWNVYPRLISGPKIKFAFQVISTTQYRSALQQPAYKTAGGKKVLHCNKTHVISCKNIHRRTNANKYWHTICTIPACHFFVPTLLSFPFSLLCLIDVHIQERQNCSNNHTYLTLRCTSSKCFVSQLTKYLSNKLQDGLGILDYFKIFFILLHYLHGTRPTMLSVLSLICWLYAFL